MRCIGNNVFVLTSSVTTTGSFRFWSTAASDYVVSNLSVQQLAVEPTSKILHVTAKDGVCLEKTDQNTITTTDIVNFKDGSVRVNKFNGSSSIIESTLSNDVNTIIAWIKPRTDTESIIDLGGGNTITVSGGTLTAAWADDIYVNGASGTAIVHNEWNHIVCRVDSALSLTAIDIGLASASYFDGLMSDVIFVDGIVTDTEISQVFSSSKMLYSK